jgi:excinuclease ABC subunit A
VLSAGQFVERKMHDFNADLEKGEKDLDLSEVGREARMPWQVDGRRWHTADRRSRHGNACRWDGRILADVIDRIQESDLFSETNWDDRSVVEIRAARKSSGWFFHAITAEEWLVKMKFRTTRNTFRREDLVARLDLKPLNDMPDLPLYGTEPRVKVKNLRGPWQEIELRVHSYEEIDRPEFWDFLDRAIEGFRSFTEKAEQKPEDLMPWKVLGRKWHLLRKGFLKGGAPRWDTAVLEELCQLLETTAPGCRFGWENKVAVPIHLPGRKKPWVGLVTKKPDAVHLTLIGPKNQFPLGRITGLGHEPELDGQRPDVDYIHLRFRSQEDLARGDLPGFLKEHLASLNGGK